MRIKTKRLLSFTKKTTKTLDHFKNSNFQLFLDGEDCDDRSGLVGCFHQEQLFQSVKAGEAVHNAANKKFTSKQESSSSADYWHQQELFKFE